MDFSVILLLYYILVAVLCAAPNGLEIQLLCLMMKAFQRCIEMHFLLSWLSLIARNEMTSHGIQSQI